MIKKTTLFILLLLPCLAQAQLKLNIGIILKRGVDKGLVLINELHSVEIIHGEKEISLKMKNGIAVYLKASYEVNEKSYGPSGNVRFTGRVVDSNQKIIKSLDEENIVILIGQSKKIICSGDSGRIVELTINPEMY